MNSEAMVSGADGNSRTARDNAEPNMGSPAHTIDDSDPAVHAALSPADPEHVREALGVISARPVRRRSFFRDTPDRGLFIVFAITGIITTLIAKSEGLPLLLTELLAMGILLAYAVISSRLEWFRFHPDRLGDNCYYMGFLFTLSSLSAALIEIQTQSPDSRGEFLESLIGSFGVALFSTIGGITLRVFFMQMRREIEDVEEVIRNELQDAAQQLKDQLGAAVQGLAAFRLRTAQVMDEQFTSTLAEFTSASKVLATHVASSGAAHSMASERLAQGAEKAAAELGRASESMAANMRVAAEAHQRATERLVGVSKKVAGEVSRLVERIDGIEVPSDLITRQVEDARERVGAFADALEAAARSDSGRQAAMERAAASLDRLLQRLADLSAFNALEQTVVRLSPAVDVARGALQRIGEQATFQASTMSALAAQASNDAAAIAQARAAAQADLVQSTSALHKLQDTLAAVAENLVKRLGEP